jgi:SAM-dependent methyltransferase
MTLQVVKIARKVLDGVEVDVIEEAVLFAEGGWFYPVIKGIPRLNVEAINDYEEFLKAVLPDYPERKNRILENHAPLLMLVEKKNRRTKESFTQEWAIYNYDSDKTWDADATGMLSRFLKETDETLDSLKGKIIFDAGCGNGLLNSLLAQNGIANIAMDFSNSIEKAYTLNQHSLVHFIQGDVQFPPVAFNCFDIVHSSGVLIATNNTELSFSCIEPLVKRGGKLSVWLYHQRKDFIHNLFNAIRKVTSKLPLRFQYYLYRFSIFPLSFIIKRMKGNKQNSREMMIDILDWFTPEFRWEHDHEEARAWFTKRNYGNVRVTTDEVFGFNITGTKV